MEYAILCICCAPTLLAVATFIGLIIEAVDGGLTKRRQKRKSAKAAAKQKKAAKKKQQQTLQSWRQ